ncbi:ABC transporter ATP-binding protein [Nitrospira sp.]|nr:ABC transporter ATP-binding protein [Nitrospira sp.]
MPPTLLLSADSISKRYGVKVLFHNLSLAISEGDRIGVIGPNGSGKSTLLKILAALETPDTGSRTVRRQTRIGYVPQTSQLNTQTIEGTLVQTLRDHGLDPHEHGGRLARALSIGQFPDIEQPVDNLSGGWRKRLTITQALLLEPDVVLMDEPTNHLDIEGILWLEALLNHYPKAYMVISHDRRFLENVASRVIELNRRYPDGLFAVKGRYSDFLEQRDAARHVQADYQSSLANRVRREVEWLRRGPKARTTKAKARVEAAESLIQELADTTARSVQSTADIDFTASGRRSKQLLVGRGLSMTLGGKLIVANLDIDLGPGERIGLLGPNGSGKTSLLRLLAGTVAPASGSLVRADALRIVSFHQHRDSLDPHQSLRRALAPAGDAVIVHDRSIHVVSWAKRFLFRPEQLDLPVGRLSGGEQARLLMARLMLQPADLLILDEPTNDLDIPTLDVLEENLIDFAGALLLVTHDRWLLDRISTKLLVLDGTGRAEWYADYAQWETAQTKATSVLPLESGTNELATRSHTRGRPKPKTKKLTYREQQEWDRIEADIVQAESLVTACEAAIHEPSVVADATELQIRCGALDSARLDVERLYTRWAELERKQAS